MSPMPRFALSMLLLLATVSQAGATGAWTTWLRFGTCNDMIASRDTVWLATAEAGLVTWLRSSGTFESIVREPGALSSNNVTAITFDRRGQLWVGTPGRGVSRRSADGRDWALVNAFDGLPSDSITVLTADGDTVWIGTARGIALWNGREIAGSVPDLGTPSPFASNLVTGIAVDGDDLFVATPAGVYVAQLSEQLADWTLINTGLFSPNATAVVSDGRDVFALAGAATHRWNRSTRTWGLAGGNGAVRRLRADAGRLVSISPTGAFAWSGTAWVAIAGSPVSDNSPTGNIEIARDPDGVTFATLGGALLEEASPTWISRRPPAPAGNDLVNLLLDGDATYVATFGSGLSRLRDGVWRSWLPGDPYFGIDTTFRAMSFPFLLQRDAAGRKWVGVWDVEMARLDDSGPVPQVVSRFFPNGGRPDTLTHHTYGWASAMDSSGFLYFGFDTPDRGGIPPVGIDVYSPQGDYIKNWRSSTANLGDDQVRGLTVDRLGYLWAGFAGRGVSFADLLATGSNRLTTPTFTPVAGMDNLDVFGVVAHGDSIWVLTTSNLFRVRGTTRQLAATLSIPAGPAPRGAVRPLAVSPDGTVWVGSVEGVRAYRRGGVTEDFRTDNSPLADNEVRAIAVDPRNGVVWFATAAGLNRYDPAFTPPPAPLLPRLSLTAYPNPVLQTGAGFQLRLSGNATDYEGEILDLRGVRVQRFRADGNGRLVWNGQDDRGRAVPAGVYFLRARGGGREATTRIVVLR